MKSVIIKFLKDQIFLSIIYFFNSSALILFYYIYTDGKIEIVYPLSISFFLFLILMAVRWSKFYPFVRNLDKAQQNKDYALAPLTCEQKETEKLIREIHQFYTEKIQTRDYEISEKTKFISQWIHNLKTPVSVIDLALQKIEAYGFEKQDGVNIQEENDRILHILEQVLNLIRLDDFAKDFQPQQTDLVANVRKVINSKKSQFIYNQVFPKFEDQDQELYVLTDPKWNELLLEQLIANGIKYSAGREGTKYIYFQLKKEEGKVILTIRDEGVGIPEYDLPRIFEPFFTGENGRSVKNSSGIGLYFSAQIAQKLALDLSVSSIVNQGTVVTLSYLTTL